MKKKDNKGEINNIEKNKFKNNNYSTLEEIENKRRKIEELKYDLRQLDFE